MLKACSKSILDSRLLASDTTQIGEKLMHPQWIIEKKRDGGALSEEEIGAFIRAYTVGTLPDYQMAALAMAIFFRGMTPEETAALTRAMMHTGKVIDPARLPGVKVDKHSTGGIGDKISLPLAPLAAACDLTVPMISGRGLGLTGGTLDKLESISGYNTALEEAEFIHVLEQVGCSIIGQTPELAPADKKLYALRDVTGTVPSIPLITASIMCKKMAEGLDALVLDVKHGCGAFMKTEAEAQKLAESMITVGRQMGRRVIAMLTNMNQPLGRTAGNALEVREALEVLHGEGPADTVELTVELVAQMLLAGGLFDDPDAARKRAREKLHDGSALEKWDAMVRAHGGNPETPLPEAKEQIPFPASCAGWIAAADAEAIGRAVLTLGAGRNRTDDSIDHAVGLSDLKKIGEHVEIGEPLCVIHANEPGLKTACIEWLEKAFIISAKPVAAPPLITRVL